MALLGRVSYEILQSAEDPEEIEQTAFNLAYHLRQDLDAVMRWPARRRREMWERVIKQYEFERKEAERD